MYGESDPLHKLVVDFAKKICYNIRYKISDILL